MGTAVCIGCIDLIQNNIFYLSDKLFESTNAQQHYELICTGIQTNTGKPPKLFYVVLLVRLRVHTILRGPFTE